MLIEGNSKSLSKALTYAPRKVFRFFLWALWSATRKTKLGKIGGLSIACAVGGYEVYRLVFPTETKIDAFLRGATFTVENFLTDNAVDTLGTEICNRWISSEIARNIVCKLNSYPYFTVFDCQPTLNRKITFLRQLFFDLTSFYNFIITTN